MPIVTHEDEKFLSALEVDIAKMMKEMSAREENIARVEVKVADMYGNYVRFLGKYVRKLRDLSKQLEILSREDRSGITQADVDRNKSRVSHTDGIIEANEAYFDKLKDLAVQKKSLLKKRLEYTEILEYNAKKRKEIVKIGLKIEEAKNKMIPAEKVQGVEMKFKDLEREFERNKKDLAKKDDQLEKEREEVNEMWVALKNAIESEMQ
ncbi:MAG: hypothetical protein ACTSWY_00865 [Promethearchaeota archaeon]